MAKFVRVSPTAIAALTEALATIFWFKKDLRSFLTAGLDDQALLSGVDWDDYKRASIDVVVGRMVADQDKYREQLISLMLEVARMEDFPHLRRLEDAERRVADAKAAVKSLRRYTTPIEDEIRKRAETERQIADRRADAARKRSMADGLEKLRTRFLALMSSEDVQGRGIELERLLRDLFNLFDLDPRASFRIAGEQIDGSFTLGETHFLMEAKWRKEPTPRADLDAFAAKVRDKIENTLGLFLSIEGFEDSAVQKHSGKGSVMILMDGGDLLAVLEARIDLVELLRRKHRHAAQTGQILLTVREIIG